MSIRIWLVRHGESHANVNNRTVANVHDSQVSLTHRGVLQAEDTGEFLCRELRMLDAVNPDGLRVQAYHSSYFRARQTAAVIYRSLAPYFGPEQMRWYETPALIEYHAGPYHNVPFDQLPQAERVKWRKALDTGEAVYIPGQGLSLIDLESRFKHLFSELLYNIRERNVTDVIFVCHSQTLKAIVASWLHYPPEWMLHEMSVPHCSVRVIASEGNNEHGHGFNWRDQGYVHIPDGARCEDCIKLYDPPSSHRPNNDFSGSFFGPSAFGLDNCGYRVIDPHLLVEEARAALGAGPQRPIIVPSRVEKVLKQ